MSSAGNARSAAYNERRTTATSGAKPRVPSARADAKDRPDSQNEVFPQDSASNTGSRRAGSGAHKVSGSIGGSRERRAERAHLTAKDTLQVRIKSPERRPKGSSDEDRQRLFMENQPTKSDSRAGRVSAAKKESEPKRQSIPIESRTLLSEEP